MERKIGFGFLNIDKPIGPTSFSVSHFIKRELNLNKTSHMGTLDPNVSGVLPIALGRACKLSGFIMGHEKKYIGILETHKEQNMLELQKIIDEKFTGEIIQIPPHKSAVKRAPRKRHVYQWKLLEESNKRDFLFIADVEGGTYIRKICSDLGELVGGAHMAELRRIQAGFFSEERMYTLYEFEEALKAYNNNDKEKFLSMIQPAEEIIKKTFPIIEAKKEFIEKLKTGAKILESYLSDEKKFSKIKDNSYFAIFYKETFIEIAEKVNNGGFIARPMFVYN